MNEYIKKSEAVDVIVKYPYEIAGKTATAIKMIEDLPSADVVLRAELAVRSFKDAATIYNLQEINKKLVSEVEELVQDGTRLEQENETLKDNNEHLAVMLEETKIELDAMQGAANSLKMHYEKAEAEVRRLRGILLQFTDIVHKWGAKNNIDTSEISLVPILQEEADSIIKKANQEYASKIFAEIEREIKLALESNYKVKRDAEGDNDGLVVYVDGKIHCLRGIDDFIAELKKKYMED